MANFNSIKFLPENLRSYDMHVKFTEVLDWVIAQYHTENIDALKALYQLKNENFDAKRILRLMGAEYFFPWDVEDEQYKIICGLLSNLYEIKGTKKGLRYILRLLGMDAVIHEWYDINEAYYSGDPLWTHAYPNCSIVLELSLGHNPIGICPETSKWAIPKHNPPTPDEQALPSGMLFEDTEGKFREFAQYLLWICTYLAEIRWDKIIEDYVSIDDSIDSSLTHYRWNHYSGYAFNCPGTIQIGEPIVINLPPIGAEGFLIGMPSWQGRELFIYDPDWLKYLNYDGLDDEQLGVIGHHTEVINPPYNVGDEYRIGQFFSSAYQQYYYIGEIHDIVPDVGTSYISGCSLSRIREYEVDYLSTRGPGGRGILISWDRAIGPGYVIDEQGDALEILDLSVYSEFIPQTSSFFIEWPEYFSNEYKPLILDDQIGEGIIQPEWRYIGQELMPNDITIDKQVYHSEVFSYNCLQIGGFGHAWDIQQNPGLFIGGGSLVGNGTLDQQGATIFKTYTHPYEIGTYFTLGYGANIGDGNTISRGMNFIGDEAPWDSGNIAPTSNTIISSWLVENSYNYLSSEFGGCTDDLDHSMELQPFTSERLKEIHTNYIGGTQTIVQAVQYSLGSLKLIGEENIGSSEIGESKPGDLIGDHTIGEYSSISHDYTIQDHYSKISNYSENNLQERLVPNCIRLSVPTHHIINAEGIRIGGIYEDPIVPRLDIGTLYRVGSFNFIGNQPYVPENPDILHFYESNLQLLSESFDLLDEVESADFTEINSINQVRDLVFPKNIGGSENIVKITPYVLGGEFHISENYQIGSNIYFGGSTESQVNIGDDLDIGEPKEISSDFILQENYSRLTLDQVPIFEDPLIPNLPKITISSNHLIGGGFVLSKNQGYVSNLISDLSDNSISDEVESADFVDPYSEVRISEKVFGNNKYLGEDIFLSGIEQQALGSGLIGENLIGPKIYEEPKSIGLSELIGSQDLIGPEYYPPERKIGSFEYSQITFIDIQHTIFSEEFHINGNSYFEFLEQEQYEEPWGNILLDTGTREGTIFIDLNLGGYNYYITEDGKELRFDGSDENLILEGDVNLYPWDPYINLRNDIRSSFNFGVEDLISELHTPIGEGVIWDVA